MPLDADPILSRLSRLIAEEAFPDGPTPFVVTPMYYPNGDSINLYFRNDGRRMYASDEGTTLDIISGGTTGLADDRRRIVESICERTEVTLSGDKILKPIRKRDAERDCLILCQAIATISGLYYQQEQQERSKLPGEIDKVLAQRVRPKREYTRNWKDKKYDPDGAFKVDYHFNGELPARNLFFVTTGGKALLVTAVVHFLRSHGIRNPSLSVVDKNARIEPRQLERLRFASDDIILGLKGHEKDVVKFALGK